jgi:hypothetical protein
MANCYFFNDIRQLMVATQDLLKCNEEARYNTKIKKQLDEKSLPNYQTYTTMA